jgi:pimeloyl-ACP methyl ester carboxylesterase
MGSVVAQQVWRRHPGVVAGLVLCSTTDRFRSSRSEMVFFGTVEVLLVATRWGLPRGVASRRRARPEQTFVGSEATLAWALTEWAKCRPRGVAQAVAACGRHDSAAWLSGIDVPTAVVVTAQDRVVAPERQRAIAERIPDATVHEVDAGHVACTNAADRFVPVVTDAAVVTARRAGFLLGLAPAV